MTHSSSSGPSQNVTNQSPNQNDVNNDEINIHLKVKKTMSLKMKRNDPIRKLKLLCYKEGGVSESLQDLIFNNEILKDSKTLADYGIDNDSTIEVVMNTMSEFAKKLYVKLPSKDKIVEIYAREDDTMHQVKLIVIIKEGLRSLDFDLMFNGRYLRSHQILSSLNIGENDCLFLVPSPKDFLSLRVQTYSKGILAVEVKKFQTVGELKLLLTCMTQSSSEDAMLFFAGTLLKDSKTIESYDIEEYNLLSLITTIAVQVNLYSGGSTMVNVYPSDVPRKVIEKTLKKLKLPLGQHPLFFNNVRLDEDLPISNYRVMEGSILQMGAP